MTEDGSVEGPLEQALGSNGALRMIQIVTSDMFKRENEDTKLPKPDCFHTFTRNYFTPLVHIV